ncbi:MAG: T9SS type A sorting domain-containing protein [Cytophagaceae bacterium]|jgi:hypothetical protein|nr:T9SS type A sorting domain-containing protein [Cytophagaceae bacterium]
MRRNLLSVFFIIFLSSCLFAQQQEPKRCGHHEYMENYFRKHPEARQQANDFQHQVNDRIELLRKSRLTVLEDTVVIPVVVHIIGNGSNGAINGYVVSDAQVYSQIDALNKDFSRQNSDTANTRAIFKSSAADIKIKFCLASTAPDGSKTNGIIRMKASKSSYSLNDEVVLKSISKWPSNLYLNIWVCRLIDPVNGELLGYSSFPGQTGLPGMPSSAPESLDGVVVNYRAFGTVGTIYSNYALGRTATHEVGHWLGLFHTWGDEYLNCSGEDYCDDVPACVDQYTQVDCSIPSNFCDVNPRMIENYMDYSGDVCMNLFTKDQKTRMRTTLDVSPIKNSLRGSFGCCEINEAGRVPAVEDFFDGVISNRMWSVQSPDGTTAPARYWKWSDIQHTNERGVMMIEHDSVYTTSGNGSKFKDVLESGYFALDGRKSMQLDVDLAYSRESAGGPSDALVIYMNGGCQEESWVRIDSLYGDRLQTSTNYAMQFSPGSDLDWKTFSYELTNLPNAHYVKFRFVSYSKGVNPLYLDNINLYYYADQISLLAYPNPSDGNFKLEVVLPSQGDVTLELFDVLGRRVWIKEYMQTTSFMETLDLISLPKGVYTFRVMSGKKKAIKKIIIQH